VLLNPPVRPTFVLIHSPLIGAAAWGEVPALLQRVGFNVVVPEVTANPADETASSFVAHLALAIANTFADRPADSVVLVAQHEAGALLPHIGAAQQAAGHRVTHYVVLNGLLPKPFGARGANSFLDLIEAGDSGRADALRGLLVDGVHFPNWAASDLEPVLADPAAREAVVAATRPHDFTWFAAPLPATSEWPDAPVTYVQSAPECEWEARQAELRGWELLRCGGGTFAALTEPKHVVAALSTIVMR